MPMPLPSDLAGQEWTPDRVQNELVREDRHWPRYELIDGELLVSPAPRPLHQIAVSELMGLLQPYVRAHAVGLVLTGPADIRLGTRTTAQPDVFVVPPDAGFDGRTWDSIAKLSLVVEVLSPSTAGYDRITKRAFYARQGVPEYWVVDCGAPLIEVSRPSDPRVELYDRALRWHAAGAPEPLAVDVRAYFGRVFEGCER